MIERGINPVFNDLLHFIDFEEVNTSVYKVRKVALPILASLAAFWASSSILAAFSVAMLVRNWEPSTTSPSEPILSDKETREKLTKEISDVSKLSQIAQEECVKQVKEIGATVAVTGNLVSQLGGIADDYQGNLKKMQEQLDENEVLVDRVKGQADKAEELLEMMKALNRQLDAARAAKSRKSSTPAE